MTSEGAWDQLRYLAALLRNRKPIPDDLADFMADAIEATEGKSLVDKAKGKAFTDELGLTANNRRKIDIPIRDVEVEHDFGNDSSQNKFTARLARSYGVTPSTIRGRLHEAEDERNKEIAWLSLHGGNDD